MSRSRPRVLALVSHFKHSHIPYLRALGKHVDLRVAWYDEAHAGAAAQATRDGLALTELGAAPPDRPRGLWAKIEERANGPRPGWAERLMGLRQSWRERARWHLSGRAAVARRLRSLLNEWPADVIHVMYYYHDALTLVARRVADPQTRLIYECRDPMTTLINATAASPTWGRERAALRAADGHIFVSRALRDYFERSHHLSLSASTLIVPHAFAAATAAPPSEKLSSADGRVHIALVGSVDPWPNHGRWYGDIIRRLVEQGLVVHSHFHELPGRTLDVYRRMAEELPDYHFHPTVTFRRGTVLSEITSRYDLMGVFHELKAAHHNEAATLTVCMPSKAVSGWFHGAIPVVTFPHYGGLTDSIREHGIGFIINTWDDVKRVAADRQAVRQATERCLALRSRFTHEHQAGRIAAFYDECLRRPRATA